MSEIRSGVTQNRDAQVVFLLWLKTIQLQFQTDCDGFRRTMGGMKDERLQCQRAILQLEQQTLAILWSDLELSYQIESGLKVPILHSRTTAGPEKFKLKKKESATSFQPVSINLEIVPPPQFPSF